MTFGPVVGNGISKDVASAVESGSGNGAWGRIEGLKGESEHLKAREMTGE
jgi:hypothetical protein